MRNTKGNPKTQNGIWDAHDLKIGKKILSDQDALKKKEKDQSYRN